MKSSYKAAAAAVVVGIALQLAPAPAAAAATLTTPPAVDMSNPDSLFECRNMGAVGGKSLYICESFTGDIWMIIA